MNNYVFYELILSNIDLFVFLLLSSTIIHVIIFRKLLYGWLDPFLLPVIANIFCAVVVYVLYLTGNASSYTFTSYNLTQIAFFGGLFIFKKKIKFSFTKPLIIKPSLLIQSAYNTFAFYFFSAVYLITQSVIYKTKGIPLFMESRLSTFADGGGAGVLGRISEVCSIFALYSFFSVLKIDKFRISEIPKYTILFLIFVTYFLSGGKGNFLAIFYVFWCYVFFTAVKGNDYSKYLLFVKKNIRKTIIAVIIVVTGIILVQSRESDNPVNPLFSLALRFLHNGDIYWYAYPNDIYLMIDPSKGFKALFNDSLGLLRLVSWNDLPQAIGIILKDIHHPSDVPSGPNARHNVFGLIYYGFFGSIGFSFVLGVVISFCRYSLAFFLNDNLVSGFIFTYLFLKISSLDTDPMLTITYINNLLFIFPIIFIVFLVLFEMFKIKILADDTY